MVGPTSYFDPAHVDELEPATAALVRRRAAALGPAYRLFYRQPLTVEPHCRSVGGDATDGDARDVGHIEPAGA